MCEFLIAFLPILWFIIALGFLKMKGMYSCVIALLIAAVCGYFKYDLLISNILTASLEGIINGIWPILTVVFAALFTFKLTEQSGELEKIKQMLLDISDNQLILLLVIGFGFGNFLEGVAGFGTSVIVPAGILASIGMDAVCVVSSLLIMTTMTTAFGSVGVTTLVTSQVTGISADVLSSQVIIMEILPLFLTPFIMIYMCGNGFKSFRKMFGITLISSLAFSIPAFLVGYFVGPELPDIAGSVSTMIFTIGAVKLFHIGEEKDVPVRHHQYAIKESIVAWLPFIIMFVLLTFTSRLFPAIHDALASVTTKFSIYNGSNPSVISINWLTNSAVVIMISAVIGGYVQGIHFISQIRILLSCISKNYGMIVTICSVMALAILMNYSGMIRIIALYLVGITGTMYPWVSPLVGGLGSFITGSATTSSALFGNLQTQTASVLGVSEAWFASGNLFGGGVGKIISPQQIALGASAVEEKGLESKILRYTFKWFVIFIFVGGALCFFLADFM